MRLWKTCYIKAWSAIQIKNSLDFLNVKILYFGQSIVNDMSVKRLNNRKDNLLKSDAKFIFLPDDVKLSYWNLFNICLVFYNSMASPYRVAFHNTQTSTFLITWEWINDFIFFLDILISFRVSYYKIDGSLQLQQNLISLKYM